jgi:diguanylate cyclase (GGDEF)-like protein
MEINMKNNLVSTKDFRKDAYTRTGTSLSFFEWIQNINYDAVSNFSLLLIEIIDTRGENMSSESYDYEKYWKFIGQILNGETLSSIFRLGKSEFVVLLNENRLANQQLGESIIHQLNKEAQKFNINEPIAKGILVSMSPGQKFVQSVIFDFLRIASRELSQVPVGAIQFIKGRSYRSEDNLSWLMKNIAIQMVELGKEMDETYHLINCDPLTGLPNLRAAFDELDMVFSTSKITNEQFAVIMIDGDGLKEMNKFGYDIGDRYICQLAKTQRRGLRSGDFLARWRMGDEFLVILKNTSSEMAGEIAERLRVMVERVSQTWLMPVTISLGVVIYPDHAASIDEMICQAEKALTMAKHRGKNQVVFADEICNNREGGRFNVNSTLPKNLPCPRF